MPTEVERIETHHLRHDFTEDELKEFSRTMAREAQDLAAAEDQKKVAVAQFAEEIARHRSIVGQMARNINNGYEMRLVPCAVLLDTPVRGTASLCRKDTGEVFRERPMNEQEVRDQAQTRLPLEEPAKPADKGPEKPPKAKAAKGGK
jgi:hypothetical protein